MIVIKILKIILHVNSEKQKNGSDLE